MRRVVAATIAAGTLALGAPTASADSMGHLLGGCRYQGATDPNVTGQYTHEGVAHLILVGDAGESITGRCVIRVNGSVRAATDWAFGTTVVTSAGRVTFTQSPGEIAQVCTQFSSREGTGEFCEGVTETQIPPQEVYDLADSVVRAVVYDRVNPTICPFLAGLAGEWSLVEIAPEGDVYLLGDKLWDCPLYDVPQPLAPPAPYYTGGITITRPDASVPPTVTRTGIMAASFWSCTGATGTPTTVTCNWNGGWFPPVCRRGTVLASVSPNFTSSGSLVWGQARGRSMCGGLTAQTAVATGGPSNAFKFIGPFTWGGYPYGWQVKCIADNGSSSSSAVPGYYVDCDYAF